MAVAKDVPAQDHELSDMLGPKSKTTEDESGHREASTLPTSLPASTVALAQCDECTSDDAWFDPADLSMDISRWLDKYDTVRILVTGRTGVGKSHFINAFGLTGEQKAPTAKGLKSETKDVTEYKCGKCILERRNNVTLYLYDSPGFEGRDRHWKITLKKIKESFKEKNPDLIYFCVRMDERLVKEDYDAMTSLSRAFGSAIWRNTVIILTRANQLPNDRFQNSLADMIEFLHEHLTKSSAIRFTGPSVSKADTDAIPIVPVGEATDQVFEGTSKPWITPLLLESLNRCTAAPALLKVHWLMYFLHLKRTILYRLIAEMKHDSEKKQAAAVYH